MNNFITNAIVIITIVVIAVIANFLGLCLVSLTPRLFTGCPVIEMRSVFDFEGFHEARKDKMQRQGKKKS